VFINITTVGHNRNDGFHWATPNNSMTFDNMATRHNSLFVGTSSRVVQPNAFLKTAIVIRKNWTKFLPGMNDNEDRRGRGKLQYCNLANNTFFCVKHHILLSCRFMLYCVALISDVHNCFGIFDCESDRNQLRVSNLSVFHPRCFHTRLMKKTHPLHKTFCYRKPSLGHSYMNFFSYFWNAKPDNGLSRAAETCSFLDYYNKVLPW
jgi:hypothetical protein